MKVTQVIKEAITARVKAKCDEANKSSNLLLKVELDRLAEELKKKILDNETKAKKYINDIILELELGATKPTLESLLNNITF